MPNSARRDAGGRASQDEHRFVCPECAQEITVNDEMRRAIIANGCPVCTASVTGGQFD